MVVRLKGVKSIFFVNYINYTYMSTAVTIIFLIRSI